MHALEVSFKLVQTSTEREREQERLGSSDQEHAMMSTKMMKDEVFKQDMTDEMLSACQRAARQALNEQSSYGNQTNKEQTLASFVRKQLEKQYPGTWSCVCGQRFGR